MSGLEFFIWAIVLGYVFARWRLYKHQEQKRTRR